MIILLPNQKIFEMWAKLSWKFWSFWETWWSFWDGNSLRWKMLEMQMPWLDIDVRVIFKNEDVVDGSVVKLIISTIPKAYNRWPLKNDDFAESSTFGKGKIFRCLLTLVYPSISLLFFVSSIKFPFLPPTRHLASFHLQGEHFGASNGSLKHRYSFFFLDFRVNQRLDS